MRRLIATLAAVVALGLAGCGSEDADSTSSEPDGSTGAPESEAEPEVDSVTVTRSGGFAGVRESWEVGPSDRGHRLVFEAASRESLADAETGAGKTPPCCDFFQYDLVVRYSDGSTATYRMYDGGSADPALDRLVNAVLKTEPPNSDPSAEPR